jgi:hypothetical protein
MAPPNSAFLFSRMFSKVSCGGNQLLFQATIILAAKYLDLFNGVGNGAPKIDGATKQGLWVTLD